MSEEKNGIGNPSPTVFLSYASHDRQTAQLLAARLQSAGVGVWSDTNFSPSETISSTIKKSLRSSDYLVVLISSAGLQSWYLQNEILNSKSLQELNDRSITVIPVLLDNVEIPISLRDIQHVDFSKNPNTAIDELVSSLRSTPTIDFDILSPSQFEDLVADLLIELGLDVERFANSRNFGFDYKVNFKNRDPFGAITNEVWFIEAKHYRSGRLSVSAIHEFAARAQMKSTVSARIALITSSQITSAAREMLLTMPIRVVEGVELKRMLLTQRNLVDRYFGVRPQ